MKKLFREKKLDRTFTHSISKEKVMKFKMAVHSDFCVTDIIFFLRFECVG